MSFNPNKLTFKTDEVTGEIMQPQVFLCDRQLNKLGEIAPVSDLRIRANLNGADEVSFCVPEQAALYDSLKDYSVVFVRGFGYFEILPTISDTFTESKSVQGNSLGETELSQLLCTLECNTDDDIENTIKISEDGSFTPTVLYNPNDAEHSLIHRILSDCAPGYETGHVDEAIRNTQRTFSFSNTDVISCFNQIAEEIECVFDVVIQKDDDGTVIRRVDIYDAQNIGEDTTIQISTDNLSDEITLSSDGNMKNCFIVEGGDELITNTVRGINPSGNGKIYMFSEETKNQFSSELREKYKAYENAYESQKEHYETIYEIQSNIFDLILYLQSGRMPSVETAKGTLQEEVLHVLTMYKEYFPNGLGLSGNRDTGSKNSIVRQMFTLFTESGYAIKLENGNYNSDKKCWTGDLILYEIQNNDSKAVIHVGENGSTVQFSDTDTPVPPELITLLNTFHLSFSADYNTYIKQRIALETKSCEYIEDCNKNTPKNWSEYSLNRLVSYHDGYDNCKLILNEIKSESELPDAVSKQIDNLITSYDEESRKTSECIKKLEDLIYCLFYYSSGEPDNNGWGQHDSSVPSSQDTDYLSAAYAQTSFPSCEDAFRHMVDYIRYGTWDGSDKSHITDAPLYCSSCGSTSVTLNGCNICHETAVTYSGIAEKVLEYYLSYPAKDLEKQRLDIRNSLDIKQRLGDTCYKELCSYIREDVYTNSNFISSGMETNNAKLVSHAKELLHRAEQELAKACVPHHTLSGNVYAFVAYHSLNPDDFPISNVYDSFKLGNYLRYISNRGNVYKLRLSSEEFSWEDSGVSLHVEFTDVVRYADGSISDIESLVQHVGNLSTSFDSVKRQAEQGEKAGRTFTAIMNEGLNSALGNVLNARNQDVQITDEGITLRKFDYELDDYSPCQMKLTNRNLVLTNDNWKTAKTAIGLGRYEGKLRYGVWADLLVGNMIIGEKLVISNNTDKNKSSVLIDKDGITLDGGAITWKTPIEQSAVKNLSSSLSDIKNSITTFDKTVAKYLGLGGSTIIGNNYVISPSIHGGYLNITSADYGRVVIDPNNTLDKGYIFQICNKNNEIAMGVNTEGNATFTGSVHATSGEFTGKIIATSGEIGGWKIRSDGWLMGESNHAGIYWKVYDSIHSDKYNYYNSFNLNGENMEMARGYTNTNGDDDAFLKFRLNINPYDGGKLTSNDCIYANMNYIALHSEHSTLISSRGTLNIFSNDVCLNDNPLHNIYFEDISIDSLLIQGTDGLGTNGTPYAFTLSANNVATIGCIIMKAWPATTWTNGAIVSIANQVCDRNTMQVVFTTNCIQSYQITLRCFYVYV